MIIPNGTNEITYPYRSDIVSNPTFEIPFPFAQPINIKAILGDTQLLINQYTIAINANNNNDVYGTLTITDTDTYQSLRTYLTIKREVPISQLQSINNKTSLATSIETAVDKLTLICEDIAILLGEFYAIDITDYEELSNRIDAISERCDSLASDLSELESSVSDLSDDVSGLAPRLTAAEGNITTLQNSLTSLTDRVSANELAISSLESSLSTLSDSVSTLNSNLDALTLRVAANETSISTINSTISTIQTEQTAQNTNISNLQTDVSAIQTEQTTQNTNISNLQTSVSTIQTEQTTQNTNISNLQTDISAIQTEQTTQNTNISALQTSVSNHETRITALENGGGGGGTDITTYNVTVPTNWTYSIDTELYSQTISVPGIKSSDLVLTDLGEVSFADGATLFNTLTSEYNKISLITINNDSITVNCSIDIPSVAVPITLQAFSRSAQP